MQDIQINIINQSKHPLPSYATPGAAGLDLRASLETPIHLQPLERTLVPTGLYMEIPMGFEGQVRPRSGLAIKQGITCLNTPGTIDSDYRGELKVILINLSNSVQTISDGDRIAQIVFCSVTQAHWNEVNQLADTSRGAGGFGHSGKQ
jgi:dUTP pyrophosphatase